MDGGRLAPERVTPLLNPADPLLRQTALWVIAHHADWGPSMLPLFREWLARQHTAAEQRDAVREQLLAFAGDAAVREMMATSLGEPRTPVETRLLLLEVMSQAAVRPVPQGWAMALNRSLADPDERIVRQAVATLRAWPLEAADKDNKNADDDEADDQQQSGRVAGMLDRSLEHVALATERPDDVRVQAAAAVTGRLDAPPPELFEFLLACLAADRPPLVRLDAAEALGKSRLNDMRLRALCEAVAVADVLAVPRLLRAFEQSQNAEVGEKLVAALGRSPGFGSLKRNALTTALASYPEEVRQQASPLFERLNQNAQKQRARLAELDGVLSGGEVQRGRELFFGNKKAICATCHAVQGQGGTIGPDLSRISAIRAPRDLLEAIVLPSASFARGYEPFTAVTTGGRVHTGVITRETSDAIYLFSTDRVESRLPRDDVETLVQSSVSIMPEGMDAQLSRQELADLLAFLQSLR